MSSALTDTELAELREHTRRWRIEAIEQGGSTTGLDTQERLLDTIAARDEEIARLSAKRDNLQRVVNDHGKLPQEAVDFYALCHKVQAEFADAIARVAQLEAALRPFAEIGSSPDRTFDYYTPAARFQYEFTYAQVAAARKAMGRDK